MLAIKECNTTGVKCGNCDKRSVQSLYCFQCCVFWCDDCTTAHNIIRSNKEHRVLALTDFQDQDIQDVLKRPAFCPRPGHEKKELEVFCKICEDAICTACGLTKMLLEVAANKRKLQVKRAIELQKRRAQQKRKKIAKLDENRIHIEEQAAAVKRGVQRFDERLMTVMKAKKYMLFAGWEVRIVKNCDRGLENAAQGRRPRAAFSRPRSQFFTIRTDLSR